VQTSAFTSDVVFTCKSKNALIYAVDEQFLSGNEEISSLAAERVAGNARPPSLAAAISGLNKVVYLWPDTFASLGHFLLLNDSNASLPLTSNGGQSRTVIFTTATTLTSTLTTGKEGEIT